LEHASAELMRIDREWRAFQHVKVDAGALARQRQTAKNLEGWHWHYRSALDDLRCAFRQHKRRLSNNRWLLTVGKVVQSPITGFSVAALGVGSGLGLALVIGAVVGVVTGFLLGFLGLCITGLVWAGWYFLNGDWLAARIAVLNEQLGQDETRLLGLHESLKVARDAAEAAYRNWKEALYVLDRMAKLNRLWEAYNEAWRYQQQLKSWLESKKYRLLHANWVAMRGSEFEAFLRDVFEALGYCVQPTKAGGDHGVDLIITRDGKRIAVQAKGWEKNVGNHAVMEVHAGMTFYSCHICVVITNSSFTRQAKELAASVSCLLLRRDDIPNLILGRISL
jgi:restriction system protein